MIADSTKKITENLFEPFHRFFKIEASGGIVLILFTLLALFWANSPYGGYYYNLWQKDISFSIGSFNFSKSVHHWINDGLMVVFFFIAGLEIKREIVVGELSTVKQAVLPFAAAFGGMIFPALIFLFLNKAPETQSGWGIPMATDIAFSLGILSLLGKRVPISLKIFLVAFAIVDDLGAVLVIAVFYSHQVYWAYLAVGLGLVVLLILFNSLNIKLIQIYIFIGIIVWFLFLKSGIHPTIAGVLVAFTIPVKRSIRLVTFKDRMQDNLDTFCYFPNQKGRMLLSKQQIAAISNMESEIYRVQSPVQRLEHLLHGLVTYFIIPLFALANAGVIIELSNPGGTFNHLSGTIIVSLILGKSAGIFLFSFLSVKFNWASLPLNVNWKQVFGLGLLGGMGFTMSLFIAGLAFDSEALLNTAKIGILAGSLTAGAGGYLMLRFTLLKNTEIQ